MIRTFFHLLWLTNACKVIKTANNWSEYIDHLNNRMPDNCNPVSICNVLHTSWEMPMIKKHKQFFVQWFLILKLLLRHEVHCRIYTLTSGVMAIPIFKQSTMYLILIYIAVKSATNILLGIQIIKIIHLCSLISLEIKHFYFRGLVWKKL